MCGHHLIRCQVDTTPVCALDEGGPKAGRHAAPLKPAVHSDLLKYGIFCPRIRKKRATIRPEGKNGGDVLFLHTATRMTKQVICQPPKMEIATMLVIRHSADMATKQTSRLSQATLNEMAPERIGYRLMLLREALGLKPSEMADMLDIERTYWSRFEGGKRAITETVAAILVERFGVTLDFIILGRWDRLPLDLAEKMRALSAEKNM